MTAPRDAWRPFASEHMLKTRARMLQCLRAFFDARGVLEVETPLLASSATTDPHLDSLHTEFRSRRYYLNTSPEFAMKRMLTAYTMPIYQICRAFRDDELGSLHNPEFSMLEWYRPGFDMHQLMDEVNELICKVLETGHFTVPRFSYRQVFLEYAGFDPHRANAGICRDCARKHGIEQPVGLGDELDDWLDWLLTQRVLPSMPQGQYYFIYDYPASQCALARLRDDECGVQVASRFELLYGELELANGFHELNDATEQRRRFELENQARASAGKAPVAIDEHLLQALEQGLPDCSGVALGLDRLLMAVTGKHSLQEVLAFPWNTI